MTEVLSEVVDVTDKAIDNTSPQLLVVDSSGNVKRAEKVNYITKAAVGLGNVNNTSDADKPISTATQTALNAKLNADETLLPLTTTGIDFHRGVDSAGDSVRSNIAFANVMDYATNLVEAIPDIRNALLTVVDAGLEAYIPAGKFRLSSFVGRTLTGDTDVSIRGAGRSTKIICEGAYGLFFNTSGCNENYGGVTIRDLDLIADGAGVSDWAIKVITGPRTKQDEGKFKAYISNVMAYGLEDTDYFVEGIIGDGGPGVIEDCGVRGTDNDYRLCITGINLTKGVGWTVRNPQIFHVLDGVIVGEGLSGTSVEGSVVTGGHIVIVDRGVYIRTGDPGDLHVIADNHINALKKGILVDAASVDKVTWVHARNNTIIRQVPRTYGDGLFVEDYGTARAGGASTIQLATTALADSGNYVGRMIIITSGTGSGQERKINSYDTGTKTATVDTAWSVTPDNTSVYYVEHIFTGIEGVFKEGTICGNAIGRNNGTYHYGIRLTTGSVDTVVDGNITQNTNSLDIVIDDSDASGISIGLNHSASGIVRHGIGAISVAGANTGLQVVSQAASAILRALSSATNASFVARTVGTGNFIVQGGDTLSRLVVVGTTGATYPKLTSGSAVATLEPDGTDTNSDFDVKPKGTGTVNVTSPKIVSKSAPASAAAAGVSGEVRIDSSYIYICTATNTWKRVAIATW